MEVRSVIAQSKSSKELRKEELEDAFFGLVHRLFYFLGFEKSDKRIGYRVYGIAIKLWLLLFFVCEYWYLFTEIDSYVEGADCYMQLLIVYRYNIMILNESVFKKLAKAMELPHFDISTAQRKQKLQYWIKVNNCCSKLLYVLALITLLAWYIYPLLDDIEYNMCLPIKLPFDYRTPILYPISYALVVLGLQNAAMFVANNDVIIQNHFICLICQFEILGDCFENILNDCLPDGESIDTVNFNEKFNDKIFVSKCVRRFDDFIEHHKTLLRHSQELRSILNIPMLGQIGLGGPLICFAAYQVTQATSLGFAKVMMSVLYLFYNMFEVLIFCLWSDQIQEQSARIRDAVYFCGWEQGFGIIPGMRSKIMLVIARATKPLVLTAGGMLNLSLDTYGNILKISYRLLTMMLQMENEE